ncbi:hypothetical protein [Solidesulfovibrio alcoholivorans]|uniref:hypothetical protein n=1 Tax=Solidesulfovibrio alcoholivorans TaxID=81406 RepID=UPI0004964D71|nr:hypothetical protein [Solidesulfovibrio alcoholivorans]
MDSRKCCNMMAAYQGFAGHETVRAVMAQVPGELASRLTGEELGIVMTAVHKAYHAGRASSGADVYDASPVDGAAWIDAIGRSVYWREQEGRLTCWTS